MKRTRTALKEYFNRGDIPTETNFADLIDSMLIQDEDNVAKTANDPLKITAIGTDEALINFYPVTQGGDAPSWQIKQRPGGKPGLGFGEPNNSRLFIETGSGKVGIGTTAPGSALHVSLPASSNPIRALTIDVESFANAENSRASYFLQVRDIQAAPPNGLTFFYIRGDGNVGIGTSTPDRSLTVGNTAGANYLNVKDGTREILMGVDSAGGIISVMTSHDLIFRTGNGEKMRISAAGNVSMTGTIVQENWKEVGTAGAPAFQNSWTNYGAPYNAAGFFKDSLGIVHLKGLIKNGALGFDKTIFTLPAGYRPAGRELRVICTHLPGTAGGAGRLDIDTDGKLIPGQGMTEWYSLDGVTFRAKVENIIVTGPIVIPGPIGPIGTIGAVVQ
jgi:hypothetical protein